MAQPTTPQEETSGEEPRVAQGKNDLSDSTTRNTFYSSSRNGLSTKFSSALTPPRPTLKVSMRSSTKPHDTPLVASWVPPQPPPADSPRVRTAPDVPVNLKYSTQGRRTLSKRNNTTLLHTITHPLPNTTGNVLPTSWAPPPPPPALDGQYCFFWRESSALGLSILGLLERLERSLLWGSRLVEAEVVPN
eukprot:scaffold11875_cov132-Isochrysis_galbana.AAC.11